MPYSLAAAVSSELLIKKSRFIGCVQPMTDRAGAQKIVAQLKALHPGAAHVCWALLAGGHSAAVDDGEPGGTAGRPMLDVLRHQDLDGVLATVVRYFGGVKLGAGGRVRAYTDSVAQALLTADKVPIVRLRKLRCSAPYALEGLLRRELEGAGATLHGVAHDALVRFDFSLPEAAALALIERLRESGGGKIAWLKAGQPDGWDGDGDEAEVEAEAEPDAGTGSSVNGSQGAQDSGVARHGRQGRQGQH
jgi:uncharacterized YigZ family protein